MQGTEALWDFSVQPLEAPSGPKDVLIAASTFAMDASLEPVLNTLVEKSCLCHGLGMHHPPLREACSATGRRALSSSRAMAVRMRSMNAL